MKTELINGFSGCGSAGMIVRPFLRRNREPDHAAVRKCGADQQRKPAAADPLFHDRAAATALVRARADRGWNDTLQYGKPAKQSFAGKDLYISRDGAGSFVKRGKDNRMLGSRPSRAYGDLFQVRFANRVIGPIYDHGFLASLPDIALLFAAPEVGIAE